MSLKSRIETRLGPVTGGGDFAARRREQQRQAAAAERKRKAAAQRGRVNARIAAVRQRERATADRRVTAAKRRGPRPRPQRESHPPAACLYRPDCERPSCVLYRDAYWQGWADKPPEIIVVSK